MQSMHQ